MLDSVPLWFHVVAAAIWVGSQVMMFAVVIPAVRAVGEPGARFEILRGVTRRFGYLGLGALVLLVLTGIDNITRHSPGDMFDIRYGYILAVKLTMVALVFLLTVLHTTVIGPAQLSLQEAELSRDNVIAAERAASLRRVSVTISVLTLLLSLAIVFCAVLLGSGFAFREV